MSNSPTKTWSDCERTLIEQSVLFGDWQVGWIPRGLQDVARGLAEYLRDYPADSATYWPQFWELADDGTLILKSTWYDDATLATGYSEFPPDHSDYDFWRWVVADPSRREGLKRCREIAMLRDEYENRQ